MKRAIICYLSYSGNTAEIAELIKAKLEKESILIDTHQIGIDLIPNLAEYDYIFLGTFTWDVGSTPDEMKDFVLEVGYKPSNIAVFGSGDTQFGGDELFCRAAERLANFYESKWPCLKIEQSPRGSQEKSVEHWVEGVLANEYVLA